MGTVYEALDEVLKTPVALKVIRDRLAADLMGTEAFQREVALARRVSHPNVCRVHELYQTSIDGQALHFLSMELLEGETLSERLSREGRMTIIEALPIVRQMCEGLAAAHAEGVIHRDFKTSNVLLVRRSDLPETRVVITDFGIARAINAPHGEEPLLNPLGGRGRVLGTPEYMAPEQVTGGPVSPATDVYALGVVIYQMVTGQLPFRASTALATANRRLQVPPPRPSLAAPGLHPRWDQTIVRCLAREPRSRFQRATNVAAALSNPRQRWWGSMPIALLAAVLLGIALRQIPQLSTREARRAAEASISIRTPPLVDQKGLRPFEVPGSTSTVPFGLNDHGDVVGFYNDASGIRHGFKFMDGKFSEVLLPVSGLVTPHGINNLRDIVGRTQDVDRGAARGFLLDSDGNFTRLDAPGAAETVPRCINSQRIVVGITIDPSGVAHGLRYENGLFSVFDVPGYIVDDWGLPCINDQGVVTASLIENDERLVRSATLSNGVTTLMNLTSKDVRTYVEWIGPTGALVGHTTVSSSPPQQHGYVLMNSRVTILDYPGAVVTIVHAINSWGTVVGEFRGSDGLRHGFISTLSD